MRDNDRLFGSDRSELYAVVQQGHSHLEVPKSANYSQIAGAETACGGCRQVLSGVDPEVRSAVATASCPQLMHSLAVADSSAAADLPLAHKTRTRSRPSQRLATLVTYSCETMVIYFFVLVWISMHGNF